VVPSTFYELEFFFTSTKRWQVTFSAAGLMVTRINFLSKQRRYYHLSLFQLSSFALSSSILSAEGRLPPVPDDPLYTNHEIWEKGVHEVTPEEQLRIKEKQKLLEQQQRERAIIAQKEQE
jgi:hypothetical protein